MHSNGRELGRGGLRASGFEDDNRAVELRSTGVQKKKSHLLYLPVDERMALKQTSEYLAFSAVRTVMWAAKAGLGVRNEHRRAELERAETAAAASGGKIAVQKQSASDADARVSMIVRSSQLVFHGSARGPFDGRVANLW